MSWRRFFGIPEPDLAFTPVDVPTEITQGMTFGGAVAPRISRAEALQVPAVLRSRNLICTPASLPLHLRNKDREIVEGSGAPTTLFDQIDPDIPNIVVLSATYEDLLFEGESLWRVLERNLQGWPTYCEHVSARRWAVHGFDQKLQDTYAVAGSVYIDGYPISDEEVIRFYSPNPPLLVHAARAIRTCLTLDQTASGYAAWPIPLGYFTPRDGVRPKEDDQAISDLLDAWEAARSRRVWSYVPSALEAKALQFNAEQIQLADQRQHAVLEIARAAGIDPEDLGVSTTSRTYQNAEQRRLDLLDFTHRAYVGAIEQRLSMRDVTPRGYEVKTNMDAFLRSDTKTRMETYKIGLEVQAYTHEEIRELEDRPALTPSERGALEPVPSIGEDSPQEVA